MANDSTVKTSTELVDFSVKQANGPSLTLTMKQPVTIEGEDTSTENTTTGSSFGGGFMQISGNPSALCMMSLNELMRSLLFSSSLSYDNATMMSESAATAAQCAFRDTVKSAHQSFKASMADASSKLLSGGISAATAGYTYRDNQADSRASAVEEANAKPYRDNEDILREAAPVNRDAAVGGAHGDYTQCRTDLRTRGRIQENTLEQRYVDSRTGTQDQYRALSAEQKTTFEQGETRAAVGTMHQRGRDTTAHQIKTEKEPHEARIDRYAQSTNARTTRYNMISSAATNMIGSAATGVQAGWNKEAAINKGLGDLESNAQSQLNGLASSWTSAAADRFQSGVSMMDTLDAIVRANALN